MIRGGAGLRSPSLLAVACPSPSVVVPPAWVPAVHCGGGAIAPVAAAGDGSLRGPRPVPLGRGWFRLSGPLLLTVAPWPVPLRRWWFRPNGPLLFTVAPVPRCGSCRSWRCHLPLGPVPCVDNLWEPLWEPPSCRWPLLVGPIPPWVGPPLLLLPCPLSVGRSR
ncbi:hypothetical protein MUK42_36959 [Musa troglodytarum]|uniref:Uncharacterized protein n=1 Tax=Musa troglodytarum TaxID=320322 RepID=A0A9E7FMK8_9LILI|nr:hypothetical protein MUK42_36959 [Musa troglodytarum]